MQVWLVVVFADGPTALMRIDVGLGCLGGIRESLLFEVFNLDEQSNGLWQFPEFRNTGYNFGCPA